MNFRKFNGTDFLTSEIGQGCWQLGGGDWGEVSDAQAFDILAQAIDSGVNFFDTADVYGGGRSEALIGRFCKETGHKVFVATKLGRLNLYPDKYTEATIRVATEASLQRLQVEALDLTQLHCLPTEVFRQGDVFEWLRKLQLALQAGECEAVATEAAAIGRSAQKISATPIARTFAPLDCECRAFRPFS